MEHFVWQFSPEVFSIGGFAPRYYGLMFAIAFVVGSILMSKIFVREGRDENDVASLRTHLIIGTIIGARLGHCLFYAPDYYFAHPLEILFVWQGGLASHGGVLGVLIAIWFYHRKHMDQGYIWLADRLTLATAFGAACIRIGNLFNSEILGKPSDVPWAIIFASTGDNVPRHPAMLYEALVYLILFGILVYMYWKTKAPQIKGRMLGFLMIGVFSARFVIEFFKENQSAFENGMALNMGQILSIPFVIVGFLFLSGKMVEWMPWLDKTTPLVKDPVKPLAKVKSGKA